MNPSNLKAARAAPATLPWLENGALCGPPTRKPDTSASKWGTLVAAVPLLIGGAVVASGPLHTDRQSSGAGEAAPQDDRRSVELIALGRLLPRDDVVTVATPYGAGDARIERLFVPEGGDLVEGQALVVLDNSSRYCVTGPAIVRVLKDLGRARGTTTVMVTRDPTFLIRRIESLRWKTPRLRSAKSTQASLRRRVQP